MPDYLDIDQGATATVTFQWGNCTRVFRKDATKPPYYKFDLDNGQSLRCSQNLAEELAGNWAGAKGVAKIHALPGDQYEVEIISQEYNPPYPLKVSEWNNLQSKYVEADVWNMDLAEFRQVGAQDNPRTPQTEASRAPEAPSKPPQPPTTQSTPQQVTKPASEGYAAFLVTLEKCIDDARTLWRGRIDPSLTGDHAGAIQDIAVHLSIECSKRGWTPGQGNPPTEIPVPDSGSPVPPEQPPTQEEPPPDDDFTSDTGGEPLPF
jgi:hypothetical protein